MHYRKPSNTHLRTSIHLLLFGLILSLAGCGDSVNNNHTTVQGSFLPWVSVANSFNNTLGLRSDNTLWAWGSNQYGQLGFEKDPADTFPNVNTPVWINPTQGLLGTWQEISVGEFHFMALSGDGTLWTWGFNGNGQLGDGSTTNRINPIAVSSPILGQTWISISAGAYHSLGLLSDGTLWGWGSNSDGQLGNGSGGMTNTPVTVSVAGVTGTKWVSMRTGISHSLGLRDDGTLWAWGAGNNGQLGDGSNSGKSAPVAVSVTNVSGTQWTEISVGSGIPSFSLGIRNDGTLWAWGEITAGLGDGINVQQNTPVQVSTTGVSGTKWISIASGAEHALGLRDDGTLWAWGGNTNGQLGTGSTILQATPVKISSPTPRKWWGISGGGHHSMGMTSDGAMWGWGYNSEGQLGNGTFSPAHSPVKVISP